MPTVNEALQNVGISHAIGLRRLSTGVVRKIIALLERTELDLVDQLAKLDPEAAPEKAARLETLLRDIRTLNRDGYQELHKALRDELIDIGSYEAGFQARTVAEVVKVPIGTQFGIPSRQQLTAAVTSRPFQGRLLHEWVEGLETARFARLRDAIRIGVVEGESIPSMVKRIRGIRALGYKDGILEISRRSATAMVRTAVNHVATQARDMTYEENADILEGWRFVATLDSRTTAVCAGLDGQVFPLGKGPMPPRHIGCRSTTVPVVKGGGRVERITYGAWLKSQSAKVQDDVLGPTRAKLFRSGEVTIDRFADDSRTYTLEELRQREGV